MLDGIAAGAGGRDPEALRQKLRGGGPLGRIAQPDDVARDAYLSSDKPPSRPAPSSSSTAA